MKQTTKRQSTNYVVAPYPFHDFLQFAANFGREDSPIGWSEGDFNGDGKVDLVDLMALVANFGFDRFL